MKTMLFISASPHKNGKSLQIIQSMLTEKTFNSDAVRILIPHKYFIKPCRGCEYCRIHKKCIIKDDEFSEVISCFDAVTHIVIVAPIYFYHLPGSFKIMIDRFQPYFYLHHHHDNVNKGTAVLYGASQGKKLFQGAELTLKYFLDTVNTELVSSYTMRNISNWDNVKPHLKSISREVDNLL